MSFEALGVGFPGPESFVKDINIAQTHVSAGRGVSDLGKHNQRVFPVQISRVPEESDKLIRVLN